MKKLWGIVFFLGLLVLLFSLQIHIGNNYLYPFPPLSSMNNIDDNPYLELGGLFLGLRSLAADIVWVKTLQYYGGSSEEESREDEHEVEGEDHQHHHDWHDLEQKAYLRLFPLCKRAVWLDPYFMHVFVLGSAAIGFVQERYDEAALLLKEGIVWNYNPQSVKYWRMNYALAALGYDKIKDYKRVIDLLEKMVEINESPLILIRVLANTYEKNKEYEKSIQIWKIILKRFPNEEMHAREKLQKLVLKNDNLRLR